MYIVRIIKPGSHLSYASLLAKPKHKHEVAYSFNVCNPRKRPGIKFSLVMYFCSRCACENKMQHKCMQCVGQSVMFGQLILGHKPPEPPVTTHVDPHLLTHHL